MQRIGRFEKIILLAIFFIGGLAVLIFLVQIKQREISWGSREVNPKEVLEDLQASVSDNVEEEKTFAYDEAGLKTQQVQEDYLAKAKSKKEQEQGEGEAEGEEVSPQTQTVAGSQNYDLATLDDPYWGLAQSPVVIVSFSDFLCPFCAEFARKVGPQIKSYYSDKVKFIFRDLPIESLHPGAGRVHEAAECAHDQGQFWPMHDLIFENNAGISLEKLKRLASQAGLDLDQFNRCLEGGQKVAEVAEDLEAGMVAGVQATPTLFINNRKIEGLVSFGEIQKVIEEELNK